MAISNVVDFTLDLSCLPARQWENLWLQVHTEHYRRMSTQLISGRATAPETHPTTVKAADWHCPEA